MYIVALAWIYVVLMMSITETSIVAGVMTFLMYGVVPVSIILYVMGSPRRRRKRMAEEKLRREATAGTATEAAAPDVPRESKGEHKADSVAPNGDPPPA